MKICDYDRCGIHSRLKNIINKSGGYNIHLSSKLLMQEYDLNDIDIAYEMAKDKKIKESIKTMGIEYVTECARKSITLRRTKYLQYMTFLKSFDTYK